MKKKNTKIFVILSLTAVLCFVILVNILMGSLRTVLAERESEYGDIGSCISDTSFDASDPLITRAKNYDQ